MGKFKFSRQKSESLIFPDDLSGQIIIADFNISDDHNSNSNWNLNTETELSEHGLGFL